MSKGKVVSIPFLILFATPWMHRLAYENMHLAVPGMGDEAAHIWAIVLSLVAICSGAFGMAVLIEAGKP